MNLITSLREASDNYLPWTIADGYKITDKEGDKIATCDCATTAQGIVEAMNRMPQIVAVLEALDEWNEAKGLADVLVAQQKLTDAYEDLKGGTE